MLSSFIIIFGLLFLAPGKIFNWLRKDLRHQVSILVVSTTSLDPYWVFWGLEKDFESWPPREKCSEKLDGNKRFYNEAFPLFFSSFFKDATNIWQMLISWLSDVGYFCHNCEEVQQPPRETNLTMMLQVSICQALIDGLSILCLILCLYLCFWCT